MTQHRFDLIVLGSGPSGGTVANKIAAEKKQVAMVESRQFGGVCALRGCNPKKVYVNAGSIVDQARRGVGKLLSHADVAIDWSQLHRFKQEFTRPVAEKKEGNFRDAGIETFLGSARFISRDTIELADHKTTLQADRFLVATGAKPMPLGIAGEDLVLQSDDFLNLTELPERMLFIGGGYISMEFAHVVARCGVQTTVVETGSQLLSQFDPDLVSQLMNHSHDRGIAFQLEKSVTAIHRQADGTLQVTLSCGKGSDIETIGTDMVIHGAGRVPNIAELSLDAGEIESNKDGLVVDPFLRSVSNPRIFATGDCCDSGKPRLTPVANEEARIAAKNLFTDDLQARPDYGAVPKVAFTTPSIASVGLNESDARAKFQKLSVRFEDTSTTGSVRKTGKTVAGYKLLVDDQTDHIVGAHLLGPAAEETINLFALAMKHGLTTTDIKSTLFAFPTFASDVREML